MVFMGLQLGVGNHGGGIHQWNISYDKVQYNRLVRFPTSLRAVLIVFIVFELRRHCL